MSAVTIRFTTRWPPNVGSLVIARLSGSKQFSHTMAIIGNRAYEASMTHGCRAVDLAEAMQGIAFYQDMAVPVPDIEGAVAFGEAQHGKPYDWLGALGIPLLMSEDWADNSKWWCSELNFAQIAAGGLWLLDPDEKKRVTPNDLRQCNYQKSQIKPASAGFSLGR
ncbi:hypothetical protein [Herbaspirillum sp. ST 5-3]|uniref:hypothetical protein n=1 Tax=Oxalobacteraceae TaxID=75682 RepID=UPI0010A3F219|nr:hypothetical protein [Herbaspirillum sp. ST 5-3]